MKHKTVYISGPMKGIPDLNYPLFNAVQKRLEAAGYTVNNPATNVVHDVTLTGDSLYKEYMRLSIIQLMNSECFLLLPGHNKSKGSVFERVTAATCGIPGCELSEEEAALDTPIILPWDKENDI